MSKMRIMHFKDGGYEVKNVDNELDTMHELVGGYIQTVYIAEDLILVCDDEGKLKKDAEPSLVLVNDKICDPIYNPCFIVSFRGADFRSLSNIQIERIKKSTFNINGTCFIKV